jgi:hypothetical protein
MLVSVACFGLATVVFALSTSFLLSMVALAVLGASDAVVIHVTLMQIETPDEMPPGAVPAELVAGDLDAGIPGPQPCRKLLCEESVGCMKCRRRASLSCPLQARIQ